jgi:type III pantothenate kinase
MLLTVDVGNTNICLAALAGETFRAELRLPTTPRFSSRRLEALIAPWLRRFPRRTVWEGVALASVVPEVDAALMSALRRLLSLPVLRVHAGMKLPLTNSYRVPSAVGADRLVNAIAAVTEFSAPVLIVDFGTAITIDAVSAQRAYLGGAILPGLGLAAQALAQGTALLPKLDIKPIKKIPALGRDTQQSLTAGIVLGAAGAVTHLVHSMRLELGKGTPVVATGGLSGMMLAHCPVLKYHRPYLTFQGLRLIWEYTGEG